MGRSWVEQLPPPVNQKLPACLPACCLPACLPCPISTSPGRRRGAPCLVLFSLPRVCVCVCEEKRAEKSHQELFEICPLERAHLLSQQDTEALAEGSDTKVRQALYLLSAVGCRSGCLLDTPFTTRTPKLYCGFVLELCAPCSQKCRGPV